MTVLTLTDLWALVVLVVLLSHWPPGVLQMNTHYLINRCLSEGLVVSSVLNLVWSWWLSVWNPDSERWCSTQPRHSAVSVAHPQHHTDWSPVGTDFFFNQEVHINLFICVSVVKGNTSMLFHMAKWPMLVTQWLVLLDTIQSIQIS